MPVVNNTTLPKFAIPGLEHQTLAGPEHGMKTLEMWMQTIAPGGGTPVHRHACEEAIVVLRGAGQITIEGVTTSFGPNSTLQIPSDVIHQIINTGTEDMFLVAALGQAPVRVCRQRINTCRCRGRLHKQQGAAFSHQPSAFSKN